MKLYLDVCCLNRPLDDQSQHRIRLESQAVLMLLANVRDGENLLVNSDVIRQEIANNPDPDRREKTTAFLRLATHVIRADEEAQLRANELTGLGFRAVDALHLACAEAAEVDFFFTTDDRLLKLARRCQRRLRVRVANPAESTLEEQL